MYAPETAVGYLTTERQVVATTGQLTSARASLWAYQTIWTKLARRACDRGPCGLRAMHNKADTFVWQCASGRQHSQKHTDRRTTRCAHDIHASPSPAAAEDPRFEPSGGCQQPQAAQHSQLTASSYTWRARHGHCSPTERRAFRPLNRQPPQLQPATPRTRDRVSSTMPSSARRSHSSAAQPRISPGKRRRNPPSRQNRRGATPRTHTGRKQRPGLATTIPTPWKRSRTVSTKRQTVPGT